MSKFKSLLLKLKKNKYSKFFIFSGFIFFFVKGLIWLIVIFFAYTGLENFFKKGRKSE